MVPILVAGAVALGLLAAGGLLTDAGPWYRDLRKPGWQPPPWLFAPAWTTILALAAWSAALAWARAPDAGAQARVAWLFGVNAALHLAWTPLFFKARRPRWALMEMVVLLASIVGLMVGLASFSPLSSWLLLPYFAWVSFALALNASIVRMNFEGAQDASPNA